MKIRQNRRKSQFGYLEESALEVSRAAATKPRQIERSTGPQRTNLNLQTGLRSIRCSVVEKSRFSDRG